ncbi:hypothetical protein Scep_013298 [Stephania cephalantha]|uniref:F-box domain-containing protein n=1 Tax=Stephania cephalantha TaxID=152367 RepID=A0AAP0JIW4_9MAGN
MATLTNSSSKVNNSINGEEEEEDRLSNLSNDILHNIFSRLNPKYSVQASVLGRRWRHAWRSLPNLNFQSDNPPQQSFLGFLNQVLILSRDTSVDVQSFNLCYKDEEAIACDVYSTWVFAAVVHNVKSLAIELPFEKGPVQLPCCLFNSKSLVDLDLGFGHEYPQIVMPSLIDLPKLKSLRLRNVAFVDDIAISRLISSCPSLEKLVLVFVVGGDSMKNLVINAPKLEKIRLTRYRNSLVDKMVITLLTPNLKNLYCNGYARTEEPQLFHALIWMNPGNKNAGVPFKAIKMPEYQRKKFVRLAKKLAEASCDVQSLVLCGRIIEAAFEPPMMMENISPRFPNLKYLKLSRTWLSTDCVLAIMYLLKMSPNIRFLTLRFYKYERPQKTRTCNEEQFSSANLQMSKECLLRHLEIV